MFMAAIQDLRHALRFFARYPGFTAAAVLSLALGIGANTAIFSLFYTIVLRPMPAVQRPEELVEFLQRFPDHPEPRSGGYWDWSSYEHFRANNQSFSSITGTSFDNLARFRREADAEPQIVILETVAGNYFDTIGLRPAAGRLIAPADVPAEGTNAGDVVVLSWRLWSTRFNRDPGIIGQRVFVAEAPRTVIGIAPPGYEGPRVGARTSLWMPRERAQLTMLARLKPGVSLRAAQAEMHGLYRFTLEERSRRSQDPRIWRARIELDSAAAGLARVRDQYQKPLRLLLAVVAMLLLLACFNVASLLLARAVTREKEMAVRIGLGAGRGRLLRQLLAESLLLAGTGAVAGAALAALGTRALARILASGRAHEHIDIQVEPDLALLAFTAAVSLAAGLLAGLAPAWHAFRSAPALALRDAGRTTSAAGTPMWRRLGQGLVAAQIAAAVFLVAAAAQFLGHLETLRNWDLGFHRESVLLADLDSSRSGHSRAQLANHYQSLLARLTAIPGVTSASASCCTPLQGCGCGGPFLAGGDRAPESPAERQRTAANWIAPGYFRTLGIPLVAGRDFTAQDAAAAATAAEPGGGARVAILNQAAARYWFPQGDAVGRQITVLAERAGAGAEGNRSYQIIGIAADSKFAELREAPARTIYFNMFQEGRAIGFFSLRTAGGLAPGSVAAEVRRTVRATVPGVTIARLTTLADQVDATIVPERLIAALSQLFSLLGAVLTGLGLFGLLAFTVARRTSEIGVRLALGATQGRVVRMILGETAWITVAGLVAGTALVIWTAPFAAALVADLRPSPALPLLVGGLALSAIALVAAWIPARRAARVNPLTALRHE